MTELKTLIEKASAKLSGVNWYVKEKALLYVGECYDAGIEVLITSGFRSIDEQNEIYKQGRRGIAGEQIVTKAKGGQSAHNYGLAIDFVPLKNGVPNWTVDATWRKCVEIGKEIGFQSGADFEGSFKDYPHLQMLQGLSIADLQAGKRPVFEKPKAEPEPDNDTEVYKRLIELMDKLHDRLSVVEKKQLEIPCPEWLLKEYPNCLDLINQKTGTADFWRGYALTLRIIKEFENNNLKKA